MTDSIFKKHTQPQLSHLSKFHSLSHLVATPVGQAGLIYKDIETQALILLLATVIRPCGFVLNTHLNSSLYVNKDDVELRAALAQIYLIIKSLLLPGEELFCLFTPLRHPLSSPCSMASSPTRCAHPLPNCYQPSAPSPQSLSSRATLAQDPAHVRCRGLRAGTEERGDVLETWSCGSPIVQ